MTWLGGWRWLTGWLAWSMHVVVEQGAGWHNVPAGNQIDAANRQVPPVTNCGFEHCEAFC
jgi:hypothetical protein